MVGMIVLGHDHFADGISGSLEMLIGKVEHYEKINYLQEDSLEDLSAKLEQALKSLADCSSFLLYTDITGGTPFNTAIRLKMQSGMAMEVIGGANVAAVLYGYMSRSHVENLETLAEECVSAGQGALVHFQASAAEENAEEPEEYEE